MLPYVVTLLVLIVVCLRRSKEEYRGMTIPADEQEQKDLLRPGSAGTRRHAQTLTELPLPTAMKAARRAAMDILLKE